MRSKNESNYNCYGILNRTSPLLPLSPCSDLIRKKWSSISLFNEGFKNSLRKNPNNLLSSPDQDQRSIINDTQKDKKKKEKERNDYGFKMPT